MPAQKYIDPAVGYFPSICVVEISGATVLHANSQIQDGSTPYTLDITTTLPKTLIVSGAFSDTSDNPVIFGCDAPIRASVPNGTLFWSPAVSTKTAPTAGTYTSSWTFSTSLEAIVFNAAFK